MILPQIVWATLALGGLLLSVDGWRNARRQLSSMRTRGINGEVLAIGVERVKNWRFCIGMTVSASLTLLGSVLRNPTRPEYAGVMDAAIGTVVLSSLFAILVWLDIMIWQRRRDERK